MLIEYDRFSIASHWVSAIENGDYTGLSDTEEKDLNAFLDLIPSGVWQWSDDEDFASDEISGLMAQCLEGVLYVDSATV